MKKKKQFKLNIDFIAGYKPANEFFTTQDELSEISKKLVYDNRLNELSIDELEQVRNDVVIYFSGIIRNDKSKMTSMMSITAVIDNILFYK